MKKEVYENIKNGDLNDLLSVCIDEELDPLVELIINKSNNLLIKNSRYIRFKSDHTKYYDLISDEIKFYGSNSIRTLYKANMEYSTIVKDVATFLNLPFEENGDIIDIEERIYNILKIEGIDIENNLNSVFLFVVKKFLKDTVKLGVSSKISRMKSGLKSYDITVPAVAYLSYLRQKILERSVKEVKLYDKTELVSISNDKGSLIDFFTIKNNQENFLNNATKLDKDAISPLLGLIPNLAVLVDVKNTKYMKVTLDKGGDLINASDGVGLRAITKRPNGAIEEHAKLFKPDQLNDLVTAGAIFQVISFIVAQKHLADINKQLNDINKKIDKIIEFQQTERVSKIEGKLKYLNLISKDLKKTHISPLETIDRELNEIEIHLIKDLEKAIESSIKNEDLFGSESFFSNMKNIMQESYAIWNTLLLSLKTRLYGVFLHNTLDPNSKLIQSKKDDISTQLKILFDKSYELDIKFLKHIIQIDTIFNSESTLKNRKLELIKQHNNFMKNNKIEKINIKDYLPNNINNQNANVILELDNNKEVISTYIEPRIS